MNLDTIKTLEQTGSIPVFPLLIYKNKQTYNKYTMTSGLLLAKFRLLVLVWY